MVKKMNKLLYVLLNQSRIVMSVIGNVVLQINHNDNDNNNLILSFFRYGRDLIKEGGWRENHILRSL
jgi:hypothetical protein